MHEFETWIYRAVIGGACVVIFFVVRSYINSVQKKFDEITNRFTTLIEKIDKLIDSISTLKITSERYEERFAGVNNRLLDMAKEINELESDMKNITHKLDTCDYCKKGNIDKT
jgi:uncharacterized coiled-coil DUF342 family protein